MHIPILDFTTLILTLTLFLVNNYHINNSQDKLNNSLGASLYETSKNVKK